MVSACAKGSTAVSSEGVGSNSTKFGPEKNLPAVLYFVSSIQMLLEKYPDLGMLSDSLVAMWDKFDIHVR